MHADLKPSNILNHEDENSGEISVKVCDFGVSQILPLDENDKFEKTVMRLISGTRQYMAPEIKQNNSLIGPEIDMWSFGIILYQMSVGYLPT